jgi:hypothetical protein
MLARPSLRRFTLVVPALYALSACGGPAPNAPVAAKIAPAQSASAPAPEPPPPPRSTARPATVAAWLHVEKSQAWASALGLTNGNADSDINKGLAAADAVLDLKRPIDAGLMFLPDDDWDLAAALPIRDKAAFLTLLKNEMDVTEQKSRFIFTPKKSDKDKDDGTTDGRKSGDGDGKKKKKGLDDKKLACAIVDANPGAGPTAICGTEHGLDELEPWLRSAPKPAQGDIAIEVYMEPLRKSFIEGVDKPSKDGIFDPSTPAPDPDAARKEAEQKAKINENLKAFVTELDTFGFSANLDGNAMAFGLRASFHATETPWVKPIFLAPASIDQPDLLFRLGENASAAMFSQGGGPLPELLSSIDVYSELSGPDHDKANAVISSIKQILMKPYGFAYGIDIPRVTKSVADLKTAKDPEKAKKALAQAIDGYGVMAFSTDVGSVEKLLRQLDALDAVDNRVKGKPADPNEAKTTIRAAAPALKLPKGSFFLDESKMVDGKTPKAPKKKEVKTKALLFGDDKYAYAVFSLSDDRAYADAAKEILARKPSPKSLDPLLTRPGMLLGGQVTSLVGAFGSHEYALKLPSKLDAQERATIVADLEKDLAAPRYPVPFALTATKNGAGGVVSFDVKGERAAFTTIFEHAFEGMGALLLLPLMLGAMGSP